MRARSTTSCTSTRRRCLSCQSPNSTNCAIADELQFQIVHQVEELWMKLIAYTLLDIDDYLQQENTNRVLTLFRRVHTAQRLMIQQIALLEIMSPKEYQDIRKRLGNGSGQESPGFRVLLKMYQPIWNSFKEHYLDKHGLTLEKIYDSEYSHGDAYVVAEALAEFDELFQKFRYEHMQLIHRTIGFGSKSLKGRPVEILEEGMRHKFFPGAVGDSRRDDGPVGRGVRRKARSAGRASLSPATRQSGREFGGSRRGNRGAARRRRFPTLSTSPMKDGVIAGDVGSNHVARQVDQRVFQQRNAGFASSGSGCPVGLRLRASLPPARNIARWVADLP